MDAKTALIKYKDKSDLVLCFFPHYNATGYKDIIKDCFKGKYFIFIGDSKPSGYSDPEDSFIDSLNENLDLMLKKMVAFSFFIEYVVIYKKKE